MAMSFSSPVSAPGGLSYAAPLMDFSDIANLPNRYYEGAFNQQQRGLNDQRQQVNAQAIEQQRMALDASRAIASGDFRTKDGGIDYSKLVQTMLKFGDVNGLQQLAPLMMQQQAAGAVNDPLLQPAPQGQGGGAGSSAPAGGGNLPPSANAGTAAPPSAAAAQPQAAPQQQPAPNGAPSGQPLTPQEPLPPGFTDPMKAIGALRQRAAQIETINPRAKPVADALRAKADRIETSIAPVDVNPNSTRLDPRTGQKLYQGPAAAALEATAHAGASPTLDADAERYLQSGQLPPNLSKNLMGQAEAKAIRDRATEMAQQRGIDTATLPQKWQQFKAQQVAIQRFTSGPQGNTIRSFNVLVDHLDTLSEAAVALGNKDNRLYNKFVQNWSAATGNPAPTNFDGVKALVGDEIVKAVVGSAGALADREEVKKDLDRASSPKQLEELVGKYKKLALDQLHGLQKQYETSTGLKNFGDMLLPGTLKALGGKDAEKTESKPDKDGWVNITTSDGKTVRVQEVKQ